MALASRTYTMDIIALNTESTVVSQYTATEQTNKAYQSEADLEKAFIRLLTEQGYEYPTIHSEDELVANLRVQLEALNNYHFSETEWEDFFKHIIANPNSGIQEKAAIIQENYIQTITREDGSIKNIYLIDKKNIHNNRLQVINQYEVTCRDEAPTRLTSASLSRRRVGASSLQAAPKHPNRYDVTILVNGLPLVHIELKRRGVNIREAFNQINRYQSDSFWAGYGLFQFVQIFVISNGTQTKYYSNSTRENHIKEQSGKKSNKKTSNSFEFTSWWADAENKPIEDLMDFARTFFAKHTLLNILTRYCIFTSDKMLMVMRPYQVVATERILNKITIGHQYKHYGTLQAGGYIWHTTGSGKTLTSFKTARLASRLDYIDKVLFVVDRQDLDYQTMREYDKFEKGAANSNTNTAVLKRQIEDPNVRIIITTIQKLAIFVNRNPNHPAFTKEIVLIFDECHRSQFGDMHTAITTNFKKYYLFGFTGTPIFAQNANTSGKNPKLKTTAQAFGGQPTAGSNTECETGAAPLHAYTIVDAIRDHNVLPFRVDYVQTIFEKEQIKRASVQDIDRAKALNDPRYISNVVKYIREHFNQKTKRNEYYHHSIVQNVAQVAKNRNTTEEKQLQTLGGFNSIFAVSDIEKACRYYAEFKKQQEGIASDKRLRVAMIYSYGVNEDDLGIGLEENSDDTNGLTTTQRDYLDLAIKDYNQMFAVNYDTSAEKFPNYYKDLALRMKNRQVDLLIVVNMFLTGFDATTLNTLWVDKNLKYHGLIQAYSRTNRILNSIKTFGNIVCFTNLEKATNDALSLFGNRDASGIVIMRKFDEYYLGYENDKGKHVEGYVELIAHLETEFGYYQTDWLMLSKEEQKRFVQLFGAILRLRNILTAFDEFEGKGIIMDGDLQDYTARYIDIYHNLRSEKKEVEDINDDIVFEMELVRQVEVNIDYILFLVRKYIAENTTNKEIKVEIRRAIGSSPSLRDKQDLIENFVDSLTANSDVDDEWKAYVEEQRTAELEQIISEERLRPEEAKEFMEVSFQKGFVEENGTDIDKILPPTSIFMRSADGGNARAQKRETVLDKLKAFFHRFHDLLATEE